MACKISIEEACIKLGVLRWHKKCFVCSVTRRDLVVEVQNSTYDPVENTVLGPGQDRPGTKKGFEKVTLLQQFVFLLRVALKRLHSLLRIRDDVYLSKSESVSSEGGSSNNNLSTGLSKLSAKRTSLQDLRRVLMDGSSAVTSPSSAAAATATQSAAATSPPTSAAATSAGAAAVEKIDDKSQVKKTVEQPEYVGSVHNLIESLYAGGDLNRQKSIRAETASVPQPSSAAAAASKQQQHLEIKQPDNNLGEPPVVSPSPSSTDQGWPMSSSAANEPSSPQQLVRQRSSLIGGSRIMFFAELSALEAFIVRHVTLLKLHPLVQEFFTMSELLDVIRSRKTTFWIKIINTLNPVRKQVRTKGNFVISINK
jgi:hypothetical protein